MIPIAIAANPYSPSTRPSWSPVALGPDLRSSPPMVITGSPMHPAPPQLDALVPITPSPLGTAVVSPMRPSQLPTFSIRIPTMHSPPNPINFQWRICPAPTPKTLRPPFAQMFTSPMQPSAQQMFASPMQTYPQTFTSPNQETSPGNPSQKTAPEIPFQMRNVVEINVVLQNIDKMIQSENVRVMSWSGHNRLVTTIPAKSNQAQFNRWANSTSGFSDIVKHLSNNKFDESGNPIAVSFIAKYIAKKYPHVYTNVRDTTKNPPRMTAVETAAMIADARVSTGSVMGTIQKHLTHHLGSSPFCTRVQLSSLTDDRPSPSITSVDVNGKHADDKKEPVHIRNHSIPSLFQAKLNRYLTQQVQCILPNSDSIKLGHQCMVTIPPVLRREYMHLLS